MGRNNQSSITTSEARNNATASFILPRPTLAGYGPDYAFDGDLMVISEWLHHSHDNHVILKAASKGKRKQIRLFRNQSGNHRYVGEIGNELFFLTNHKAPNRKVVAVEIDRENLEVVSTRVIVPESESHIKRAYCLDHTVLLEYMNKSSGRTVLIESNLDGQQKRVKLPDRRNPFRNKPHQR